MSVTARQPRVGNLFVSEANVFIVHRAIGTVGCEMLYSVEPAPISWLFVDSQSRSYGRHVLVGHVPCRNGSLIVTFLVQPPSGSQYDQSESSSGLEDQAVADQPLL